MFHIFSGMGNSAAVAARLELRLPVNFADDVWVFPVYSWGVPPVVVKHLEGLDLTGKRLHMVCTCGDDTGMLDRQWRELVESRGGQVGSIYSVQMPNTYVCFPFMDVDAPDVTAQKLQAATERVDYIAQRLTEGIIETDIKRGAFPRLKSAIYPGFCKYMMDGSKFAHTSSCTGCGKCISLCPKGNISRGEDGLPQWGTDCAFCLRCYHVCPAHAVRHGSQTRRKGQYLHPDFQWLTKKFKNI